MYTLDARPATPKAYGNPVKAAYIAKDGGVVDAEKVDALTEAFSKVFNAWCVEGLTRREKRALDKAMNLIRSITPEVVSGDSDPY